ncbi:hypothetical protein LOTGIDRAFT_168338 [Lottia gigantea]|uniref:E2F/DP family winged-helix DNA-binding domain-containing protein n=1 Tax=Lottia gigantea TaxID=225164 RepID=V4B851_LOTGI|nr:hypothetical protein LOTGIDRAFT_168338 [Lottia gigantea]ESO84849.1 hypothetical protein LOTGIDRAFT_168338 [Lottia gigantea]
MADVTEKILSAKLRATLTESEDDSDNEVRHISERIPFNRNTNNNNVDRSGDVSNKFNARPLNKDKENSPKILRIKSRRHLERNDSSDNIVVDRPVTPVKDSDQPEIPQAPLTPTTNLKMLFSAVSPEIRKMQDQKRQEESLSETPPPESEDSKDDIIFSSQESDSGKPGGSRKEKSLGLLCQKFLQRYPEYPKCHLEVCLDEVAKDLNVERRRIYDIVNVLESVEIVSRIAKNKYAWHGKTNLVTTLTKLKMLAEKEGFGDQIEKVKEQECYKEFNCHKDIELLDKTFMQKDKSLGIMSQKFLMLFLISKPKTVNLDISAKILIGDPTVARNESSKFKTKIRRLYDIANILTSLNLIRKVHVTEIRGRKPAFRYIGPDVDTDTDVSVCCSDGIHRPTSRHSLLDCIRNKEIANLMAPSRYIPIKPALGKKYKSEILPPVPKSDVPKRFSRHASFDMICEAAEKERSKLYGRSSEPSSPVKKLDFNNVEDDEIPEKTVSKEPSVADSARKKIFVYNTGQISVCQSPLKNTTAAKKQEKVVVRPTTGVPQGTSPTIIPLTQQQINAVLKSLNVPVTRQKTSATLVDACTQSSPSFPKIQNEITDVEHRSASPEFNMAVQNETTPSTTTDYMRGLKRGLDRQDSSMEKRIKMALPTPPSTEEELTSSSDGSPDAEVSEINQRLTKRRTTIENGRPSPLRALHLAPEFKSAGNFKTIAPPELPEDSDLATPLPEDFDAKKLIPLMKPGVQQLTVKMANHPHQFIQVPVMHIPKTALTDMERQHVVSMSRSSLIQSLPLNSLNANQPINFAVPMTFSSPLTPATPVNPTSSPSFFPHAIISTNSSAFNISPPQPSFTQASAIQMIIPGAQPMKMAPTQFISQSASSNTVYHNMG